MIYLKSKIQTVEIYPSNVINESFSIEIVFQQSIKIKHTCKIDYPFENNIQSIIFKFPKNYTNILINLLKNDLVVAKGSFILHNHIIESHINNYRRMIILEVMESRRKDLFEGKLLNSSFRLLLNFKFMHSHTDKETCGFDCYHNPINKNLKSTVNLSKPAGNSQNLVNITTAFRDSVNKFDKSKYSTVDRKNSSLSYLLKQPRKQSLSNSMSNIIVKTKPTSKCSSILKLLKSKYFYNKSNNTSLNLSIDSTKRIRSSSCNSVKSSPIKNVIKPYLEEYNIYEKSIEIEFESFKERIKYLNELGSWLIGYINEFCKENKVYPRNFNIEIYNKHPSVLIKDYMNNFFELNQNHGVINVLFERRRKELKGELFNYTTLIQNLTTAENKYLRSSSINFNQQEINLQVDCIKVQNNSFSLSNKQISIIETIMNRNIKEEEKSTHINQYSQDSISTNSNIKKLLLSILIKNITKIKYNKSQIAQLEFLAEKYVSLFNEDKPNDSNNDSKAKETLKTKEDNKINSLEDYLFKEIKEYCKINQISKNIIMSKVKKMNRNTYLINNFKVTLIKVGSEYRVLQDRDTVSIRNAIKQYFKNI